MGICEQCGKMISDALRHRKRCDERLSNPDRYRARKAIKKRIAAGESIKPIIRMPPNPVPDTKPEAATTQPAPAIEPKPDGDGNNGNPV